MNIYLIGFMGTGKSSVGKELASRLKKEFVDLDAYIEAKSGKKIADIFALAGEGFFRTLETKVLSEISGRPGLVVSCGGGIVTAEENIRVMKRTGTVVCLTAEPDVMLKRCAVSGCRPLLNTGDPAEAARKLLAQRLPLYEKAADIIIDTSSLSISQAADEAQRQLGARKG